MNTAKPRRAVTSKPVRKPAASAETPQSTPEPPPPPPPAPQPQARPVAPDPVARGFGRIPVTKVSPVIEGGSYPAKAVVGELIPIRAAVFREGHDAVNASVILTDPAGKQTRTEMTLVEPGLDKWLAYVRLDCVGPWTFRVEGWSDPWHTWLHNAEAKLKAGIDIE
ncbi:MAG: DUF3416 domain-containing protein, partial [Propionibacteriaceae bacterium]|nr:DUF3416 domain-containing protein [Propionibacteriaceae bacterium]